MKRLFFVFAFLLLVVLTGVLVWEFIPPSHEGATPQEWFKLALSDQGNLPRYAVAFRRLGGRGAAFLAGQLSNEAPYYARWYDEVRQGVGRWVRLPPLPGKPRMGNEMEVAKKLLGYLEGDAAPALIRRLKRSPPHSRKFVVQAMGELGPAARDQVGPHLARCLQDTSTDVLCDSIASLGMVLYEPEEIIPRLIPLLYHTSQPVRLEASYTLGSYPARPEITLEPLRAALDDNDGLVRANVARALGKLGTNALPAAAKLRAQLNDAVLPAARAAEALVLIDPQARDSKDAALEEALRTAESSDNDYFRLIALSTRLRLGERVPWFVETCRRQMQMRFAAYFRWEAVERLVESEVAAEETAELLREAAADSNGLVRQKAKAKGGRQL